MLHIKYIQTKKSFQVNDIVISNLDGSKGEVLDIGRYTNKIIIKWFYSQKITLEHSCMIKKYFTE